MGYTIQSPIVIRYVRVTLDERCVRHCAQGNPPPPTLGECLQRACPHVCDRVYTNRRVLFCVHVYEYMRDLAPRAT